MLLVVPPGGTARKEKMNEKVAKNLKDKADLVLLLMLFLDVGVAAVIITSPHLSVGWLVFWWAAEAITLLMSATTFVVFALKPVGGEVETLEGMVGVASWILRVGWFAQGSYLVLLAAGLPWTGGVTFMLTLLYFFVLLLCFSASPGSKK